MSLVSLGCMAWDGAGAFELRHGMVGGSRCVDIVRILIYGLNYAPEPVGIGKYTGELAAWLGSRGHHVRVLTSVPYFPTWRVGLNSGNYRNRFSREQSGLVTVLRCPLWVPKRPNGLTRLLHLASFALTSLMPLVRQLSWSPQVVITIAPALFCAPAALLFSTLSGRKTHSWLHVQDFELDAAFELGMLKGGWIRTTAERWESSTLMGFDRVSSISGAMMARLRAKGVGSEKIRSFPNWVDLTQIKPADQSQRATNSYRCELGIDEGQLVLMYSGSMNKKQGLDLLVDVIEDLADQPQLVWLLAGEGPSKESLEAATRHRSNVRVMPLQPFERLNDWLNAADVHLLPQKQGAADLVLPSKMLGILASGRPVVASSPAGSDLASLASEAGRCVPPDDAQAFAAALRQLIDQPDERLLCGQRARQLVEARFGSEAVLSALEQQLFQLSGRSGISVS